MSDSLPAPVVMLADDNDEFRGTVAFHLAMAGYPVVEAGTVSAAFAQSRDTRPDIVVVSDAFAGGDVGALLESLHQDTELRGVPVITLSSEPGAARLVECLAQGARDHVRRQDGADELVARVDAVIRADDELERLRRRNAELEFLGATDTTTGLANRRQVEDEYDRMRAGAARHHLPLSVAMTRVDSPAAPGAPVVTRRQRDAIMREVGYLLSAVRRADDFAGAWDESTFVLLLPMTPIDGALSFVHRLQTAVTAAPVHHGDERLMVTMSSACAPVGDRAEGLLLRLDRVVTSIITRGGDAIGVTA